MTDFAGKHVLEVRDLHFERGRRAILSGMNIRVPPGQIIAILGGSGTGKTTLLQLMGGQLQPSRGEVLMDGVSLRGLSTSSLYDIRKRMGMLFQHSALLTDLSVYENVAFPLRRHTRLPESYIRSLVMMKLEAVGLRGARDLMPPELSGGMARRVALARAVVMDPMLIFYDEPFTGLDPISLGVVVTLIKQLNEALGASSVLVSHDVAETLGIADYAYVLAGGRVIGEGTPSQLQQSDSPLIRQFLRGDPDGPVPFHYPASRSYEQELLESVRAR